MGQPEHPADQAAQEVIDELMYETAYDSYSGKLAARRMAEKWKEAKG